MVAGRMIGRRIRLGVLSCVMHIESSSCVTRLRHAPTVFDDSFRIWRPTWIGIKPCGGTWKMLQSGLNKPREKLRKLEVEARAIASGLGSLV